MKKLFFLTILFSSLALCRIASASEGDEEVAIFSCDVLNGRKFVELCASSTSGWRKRVPGVSLWHPGCKQWQANHRT